MAGACFASNLVRRRLNEFAPPGQLRRYAPLGILMDESTNELTWEPYVGRGALGGALGVLLVVAVGTIYVLLRFGAYDLTQLLVVMGVMGVVDGVITGLAVGYMIYKLTARRGSQLTIVSRIPIGIVVVLTWELLRGLTSSEPFHPTFVVGYARSVGGLAGLFARSNPSATSVSVHRA